MTDREIPRLKFLDGTPQTWDQLERINGLYWMTHDDHGWPIAAAAFAQGYDQYGPLSANCGKRQPEHGRCRGRRIGPTNDRTALLPCECSCHAQTADRQSQTAAASPQ